MENRYKIQYDVKRQIITNIKFKQGDTDSCVLDITLLDNGIEVDITGETIEFRFLKPDNTVVFQDISTGVTITDSVNGLLECVLKSNTLASAGIVKCEIHRSKDGKELTTPSFYFLVEASIVENGVLSSNYIGVIEKIKNDYETATHENTVVELVNARAGEINLNARLDKMDTKISFLESTYTATANNTKNIPINIATYTATDKLEVTDVTYGDILVKDKDYTIASDYKGINLINGNFVNSGEKIYFRVYKK